MNYHLSGQTALAAATLGSRLDSLAQRPFWIDDPEVAFRVVMNSSGEPVVARTNATALLQYQEWLEIDRVVIDAALQRLVAISDLRSRGLEHGLGSIGTTISIWDRQSEMTQADISMSGITRGEKDTPAYSTAQVPVPIVHKEFSIELRRLEASRRSGESLDTTSAALAGRVVAERSETMLFNGASVSVDGSTIYGYTTFPDRNTVTLTLNWTDPSKTGALILADVQAMLAAARADRHFGPYVMYVPSTYEGPLESDYRAQDSRTVKERILALNGIQDVKVADFLAANNVLLVQMSSDTVDLAVARDITTVQWNLQGGMLEEFKTMAVWVPRLKSDFNGNCGIVHLRP